MSCVEPQGIRRRRRYSTNPKDRGAEVTLIRALGKWNPLLPDKRSLEAM